MALRLITGLLLFALGIYFFTSSMADVMRFALGFPCLAAGFLMMIDATKKRKPPQSPVRPRQTTRDKHRYGGGNGHSDPDGAADSDGGGSGSSGDGGD